MKKVMDEDALTIGYGEQEIHAAYEIKKDYRFNNCPTSKNVLSKDI